MKTVALCSFFLLSAGSSLTGQTLDSLTTVYGTNGYTEAFTSFEITSPETTEVLGYSPLSTGFGVSEQAGAIDPANPATGYVLDTNGDLYGFDVSTGAVVYSDLLGNIPEDWTGMEYDRTTGTLYGVTDSQLFIIDPVAVTDTLVGALALPAGSSAMALAIDGNSTGYVVDGITDALYAVDLTTGTTSLVGPIGFDANFGLGMCYDPVTDKVYMADLNLTNPDHPREWRSIDLATGVTTLIGEIVFPVYIGQLGWASIGKTIAPLNVGVGEASLKSFSYAPNPAYDVLDLVSDGNIGTVALFDMLGEEVIATRVDATTARLNISALAKGTYVMKVSANGQLGTFKVVKD